MPLLQVATLIRAYSAVVLGLEMDRNLGAAFMSFGSGVLDASSGLEYSCVAREGGGG